jgi:hypothetical protein
MAPDDDKEAVGDDNSNSKLESNEEPRGICEQNVYNFDRLESHVVQSLQIIFFLCI